MADFPMSTVDASEEEQVHNKDQATVAEEEQVPQKNVSQLLISAKSHADAKKIIREMVEPKLEQQESAHNFITSLLLNDSILLSSSNRSYRNLLAKTTAKAILKSPKSIAAFTTFINSTKHAKVLTRYTNARLTVQYALACGLVAYLETEDKDRKLIESSLFALINLTTLIYLRDGQSSLYEPFGLNFKKFKTTGAYKMFQSVVHALQKKKFEDNFYFEIVQKLASQDNINEFVVASSLFPTIISSREEYIKILSDVILKCTQQNINVADMDWSVLFEKQLGDVTTAPGLIDSIEKAFRRGKNRIGPIVAQLSSVHPMFAELSSLAIELLKSRDDANLQNLGADIIRNGFSSSVQQVREHTTTSVVQALEGGGMDHAAKIKLFKMFAQLPSDRLEERYLTMIQSTLPQRTENDQVRAQICDTLTACYIKRDDWNVSTTLVEIYINILQTASTSSTTVTASTTGLAPIENDSDFLKKRILNAVGDLAPKLAGRADLAAASKKITEICTQIVVNAEKKFAERPLAIYAARALLKLSITTPPVISVNELVKSKIYSKALSGKDSSYLVSLDTFQRLLFEPDYVALADLIQLSLFEHSKDLALNNVNNEIMTTACRVLANSRSRTAQNILRDAARLEKNRPMSDKIFVQGFPLLIKQAEELEKAYLAQKRPEDEEESKDKKGHMFNAKSLEFSFFAIAPDVSPQTDVNLLAQVYLY